ncbi:MAG: peptide chain release factor N(5)-glutamine methyltransferase [Candidatus Omnitrophota bacterium]|nr:peptide chain release factor N(5)-glutamine methyltransferase [Candidatus Omnitrophota bacterium]
MTETELLFTDILNCNRLSLYLNKDIFLDKAKSSLVSSVLKKRIRGEPLQYILGKTEFMGLEFKITPDVFIPRPETEILVEKTIDIFHSSKFIVHSLLDIGTGSGCIAISLAKFLPKAKITAIDISENAIKIAKQNALLNNVKVNFLTSDLFSNYELRTTNYELIISNPPYIPTQEIETLQPEVKYEPYMALDGGKDGLNFYRRIIDKASRYLKKGGFLIMEMGFNQKDAIKNIFQKSGYFQIIESIKDYNNMDRVIIAKKRAREWIN